jgi:hypothetical protein
MRPVVSMLVCSLLGAPVAWADPAADDVASLRRSVQELTATVQRLTATVQQQAQQIASLQGVATPAPAASAGLARPPAVAGTLSAFNPEIGVLADVVAQASESSADGEGNDKVSAREVELVFGHPIDPYSRLDVTLAFSDFEEAALEEAYITHWGLPGEWNARVGRFRPKIGKASPLHRDSLDTVDEPLVVAQYLGAEGLSRTGADVTGFLPTPWDAVTHEVTTGILEGGVGEGGTLLGEVRRRPSFYAHLKNFVELTDVTNMELGATWLSGSKDDDNDHEVQVLGLDATLIHHVTPTQRLKWQTEAFLQDRDEALEETTETDPDTGEESVATTLFNDHPWGAYSLLDYRLSPRFGLGGRVDYVEPNDLDPALLVRDGDLAWSGYLTFYQSEFARWRLQVKHTDFALGGDDNSVFLQGTVAIGVHKHQIQ